MPIRVTVTFAFAAMEPLCNVMTMLEKELELEYAVALPLRMTVGVTPTKKKPLG
jgi:hypothetical protein